MGRVGGKIPSVRRGYNRVMEITSKFSFVPKQYLCPACLSRQTVARASQALGAPGKGVGCRSCPTSAPQVASLAEGRHRDSCLLKHWGHRLELVCGHGYISACSETDCFAGGWCQLCGQFGCRFYSASLKENPKSSNPRKILS